MKLNIFNVNRSTRRFLLTTISLLLLSGIISFYEGNVSEPDVLSSTNTQNINENRMLYEVEKVVDGDTVKLKDLGTVRLIGVDTPETVHPNKEVQCFGKEATEEMKKLLNGKKVYIEYDFSQGSTDRYGRYLVYLYTQNNLFINQELIKNGYAYEYTYRTEYKYQKEFKKLQELAENTKIGLWGDICNI